MANTISNSDDVIDSRDVIDRIELLEGDLEAWHDEQGRTLSFEYALQDAANFPEHADEYAEWKVLTALAKEAEGYADDWTHGEALIRDSHFEDYAQELAEDCAPFSRGSAEAKLLDSWPYRCIDWKQAARELQMDYTQVDFDGVAYWIR